MKRIFGITLFFIFVGIGTYSLLATAQVTDQQLVVGRSLTLAVPYDVGDIAVSDASICSYVVRDNRREIYLNPLKPGNTTLTIWDKTGKQMDNALLVVVAIDANDVLSSVQSSIKGIPGIKAYLEGEMVVISGEVHSPAHLAQIQSMAKEKPNVRADVRLSAQAMGVIAKRIEEEMNVPGISVRSVRDKLIMEGLTYSQDIYKKIDTIAKLYSPDIINLVEVRQTDRRPGYDKTVRLDVYFMEIKNSAVRSFGINWAPGAVMQQQTQAAGQGGDGGFLGLTGGLNAIVGFVFNLVPKLRWIHETGRGRVLEKPTFIVKSGEPVDFFSGTEVPYFSDSGVAFKNVGVNVHAEPIATQSEVDLKISVDVSSLSSTVSQAIDHDNVSTSVYVKSGEAVVLGGLLRNGDVKTYNKVPQGLDTSSALFTLFLSRDFQTHKSQFYVFIVPTILDQPEEAEVKLKKWLELNKEIELSRKFK